MEQFPTGKDLSSWAGVCPGNNRSAGKNKSSRTTGGNPWLRAALTECAWAAAAKKDCFLKGKFWRIVTKSGGEKARAIFVACGTSATPLRAGCVSKSVAIFLGGLLLALADLAAVSRHVTPASCRDAGRRRACPGQLRRHHCLSKTIVL